MTKIGTETKGVLREASLTMLTLLKIMVPVSIIVKILKAMGAIEVLGDFLAPVMKVVGLPGESGLVWATAMVTNIYGGLVAFLSVATRNPFTVAQVTVLSTMILVAHNLPVELRIAQKAGTRLWFMLVLRIFAAFAIGSMLNAIYGASGLLQNCASILWKPGREAPSLLYWIIGELKNYGVIFLIILVLISLMTALRKLGFIDRLNRSLRPVLEFVGMSKAAAPITMLGMTLGLSYGGGLIINEARSGLLSKKDIFLSMSLMGLSHGLIEDTLLMCAIGASLSGTLLARVLFTIVVMYVLIQCVKRLPEDKFDRCLVRRRPRKV